MTNAKRFEWLLLGVDYQTPGIHDADMSVALKLYDELRRASSDDERAHLIADAFERFEERYPNLQQVVTSKEARETELRLQKEIEGVRLEIKQVEGSLQKEIEGVRLEIKQVEGSLGKEIKSVELRLTQAMHKQTLWVIGSIGTILAIMRFLDSVAH